MSQKIKRLNSYRIVFALICFVYGSWGKPAEVWSQSQVTLNQKSDQYELMVNGKPFTIKGVGGHQHLDQLAAAGGNSFRTWSAENLEERLQEAAKYKLMVCVGIWLGHERHGFNYQDEEAVNKQLEGALEIVRKYKDHPQVLLWGIGNEMEGSGKNPAIWYAVDHIAREIKKIDPNHPTMTVIAEMGENKVQNLAKYCPNIDIIGINSYGGISSLARRYRETGVKKPYIVTEHGPTGPWEVEKTGWGAPLEATSTTKAEHYLKGYQKTVVDDKGKCLGSYAFLWGHKQETTATWFGMLLPDGTKLGPVDAMSYAWKGEYPQNRCPEISKVSVSKSKGLKQGEVIEAKVVCQDVNLDSLSYQWVLSYDSVVLGQGGDAEAAESIFKEAITSKGEAATVKIPQGGGGYRLFVYVRDGKGGAAVANVCLNVEGPQAVIPASEVKLPFLIYGDEMKNESFFPSGYMGNNKAIVMTKDCKDQPHAGETCYKVQYQAGDQWGGVVWHANPDDWEGKRPGGLNLTGATALEFYARGDQGGEEVNFSYGIIKTKNAYHDSSNGELKGVKLTKEWQKYQIELKDKDLSRVKTGFVWSLAGQGKPVTFYLDDIRFERE